MRFDVATPVTPDNASMDFYDDRLPDRALVSGIPEGSWVQFTAKNVDGENIVTSIHVVAECKRFQPSIEAGSARSVTGHDPGAAFCAGALTVPEYL